MDVTPLNIAIHEKRHKVAESGTEQFQIKDEQFMYFILKHSFYSTEIANGKKKRGRRRG
jgi:hypothetical protein